MSRASRTGVALTFGEGLGVLRTTSVGSLSQLTGLDVGTGGAEFNVAMGLARLGTEVSWLGRTGEDGLGRRIIRELRAEGVNVIGITDPDAATGLLLKESPYPDRTEVTYYRRDSAGSRLQPTDLDKADFAEAALLHVTGITPSLSLTAAQTVERALDLAQEHSVPVSFDVNHRSRLWGTTDAAPVYRKIAKRASLIFAGIDEAELLVGRTGLSHRSLAEAIAELGAAEVILKLGADGAYALDGREEHYTPAIPISAVDTVGAGDAFVAGYLAEWLNALPLRDRLATAVRTGAAACLHPGDWEGSPTRNGLKQFDHGADPVLR